MKYIFIFLVLCLTSYSLAEETQSRFFKQRVRSQDELVTSSVLPVQEKKNESSPTYNTDFLAALAKVQKEQAETFNLWASQFRVFKNNVMKFMDQTSDILQKNEKKIKTLQQVVRKIARDIDE